jgi:hypothetical protein
MVTRSQFRWAARWHWIWHTARCIGVVVLGFLAFGVVWFLLERFDAAETPEMRAEIATAVAIAAALPVGVFLFRRATMDAEMYCPHCHNSVGYFYVVIVYSSGNCPNCGERMLDD